MLILADILTINRIIPVLVIDKLECAVPLAMLLVDSGFTVLEITLRTACALEAIKQIANKVPKAVVGAGTIITPQQLSQVKAAGAQFAMSPGLSKQLIVEAKKQDLAYLFGISTPSEALCAYELGATHLKFFPAESMGGIKTLSAIAEVLPLHFCPTGGVNFDNFVNYLALPCVSCIGGTWITPRSLIQAKAWNKIAQLAEEAQNLLKDSSRNQEFRV
jgi:2-dehydro-3-deoxyphosphogluconate aldolase/(4S)-4-hydroxy-2-oxoglutarate aldolase